MSHCIRVDNPGTIDIEMQDGQSNYLLHFRKQRLIQQINLYAAFSVRNARVHTAKLSPSYTHTQSVITSTLFNANCKRQPTISFAEIFISRTCKDLYSNTPGKTPRATCLPRVRTASARAGQAGTAQSGRVRSKSTRRNGCAKSGDDTYTRTRGRRQTPRIRRKAWSAKKNGDRKPESHAHVPPEP